MTSLIVVDATNISHICKHAMKGLSWEEKGTGVIFGFLRMVRDLAKKFGTDQFAFAWDSRSSLRKDMYPGYKVKRHSREKTKEEKELDFVASLQFEDLKRNILPKMGFANNFEQRGYEADDVIANVVINHENAIMVSTDNDLFQLLPYGDIWDPRKKELVTPELFIKRFGITPTQWVTMKCLAGCSSDEVLGIRGVGELTALRYIRGELKKGKVFDRIEKQRREMLAVNRTLVMLPLEGTRDFAVRSCRYRMDDFLDVFEKYGMRSFLSEFDVWKKLLNLRK
jgi:DNA polymerase-1